MPSRWTDSNLKLPDTKVLKGRDIKNDLRPAPRGGHACVALSPLNIVIHGGADRSPKVYNDTWLLTCEGRGLIALPIGSAEFLALYQCFFYFLLWFGITS
jgi:hypothetical protein